MAVSVALSSNPVLQFFDNSGAELAGGMLTTTVGGLNYPTYSEPTGTFALPNPIILNSRGEIATAAGTSTPLYLQSGVNYTFTLQDSLGNTIWVQSNVTAPLTQVGLLSYLTQSILGGILYPLTAAETTANVTPSNFTYPELDPRRYGFLGNGVANDYASINASITVAQQYTSAKVTFPQNSNVICNSPLTWNVNTVALDFNGSTLNFTGLTVPSAGTVTYALNPTSNATDPNLTGLTAAARVTAQNGYLIGPGVTVTGIGAILVQDTANNEFALTFRNLSFLNFSTDAYFGTNAFECRFDHCYFTLNAGTPVQFSITGSSLSQAERIVFTDCDWYNRNQIVNPNSGSSDYYFYNCSWDYFSRAVTNNAGARIHFVGGHIELNTDNDTSAIVSSAYSALFINNSDILIQGPRNTYDLFTSDSTCTNGGVFIRDCYLALSGNAMTTRVIGNTGNARVDNLVQQPNNAKPILCAAMNLMAYGTFEALPSASADGWTFSNGGTGSNPAVTTAFAHSGTHSLGFTGASGSSPTATLLKPCKPTQQPFGEVWVYAPNLTATGSNFQVNINYVDNAANIITTQTFVTYTASLSAWTRLPLYTTPVVASVAPAGTVSVQIVFILQGTTSGTPTVYIDDVVLNVN